MGFGLVEMLKNEMPLVWFSREIEKTKCLLFCFSRDVEKLNAFGFGLVDMLKS